MKKEILLLIILFCCLGAKAQMAERFFESVPNYLPSVKDIAYVNAFPEDPEKPANVATHKRVQAFFGKVTQASMELTGMQIKEAVQQPGNVLTNVYNSQITTLMDSLRNSQDAYDDDEEIEFVPDTTQVGVFVFSSHASGGISDNYAEYGWKENEMKWTEEYSKHGAKVMEMEQAFFTMLTEYKQLWWREYGNNVSECNKKMDNISYNHSLHLITGDADNCSCEDRIKEIEMEKSNLFYEYGMKKGKEMVPMISDILNELKKQVPFARGMDNLNKSKGVDVNASDEGAVLQDYARMMMSVNFAATKSQM